MTPPEAATAEKTGPQAVPDPEPETEEPEGQEPETAPAAIGQAELFLGEEYAVTSIEATLGGITEDIDSDHPLYGVRVGDDGIDLVIRNVKVTGGKVTHKGKVSLILHGETLDVLEPRGLKE